MDIKKNTVIAGDYEGKLIVVSGFKVFISLGFLKTVLLNEDTVDTYEYVDENTVESYSSGIARGLIGGTLAGSAGMLLGMMSAKKKKLHLLIINFKDGKKSLVYVANDIYEHIKKKCKLESGIRLIKCPACGNGVSNMANSCPKCGQPINRLMDF